MEDLVKESKQQSTRIRNELTEIFDKNYWNTFSWFSEGINNQIVVKIYDIMNESIKTSYYNADVYIVLKMTYTEKENKYSYNLISKQFSSNIKYRKISGKTITETTTKLINWFIKNKELLEQERKQTIPK